MNINIAMEIEDLRKLRNNLEKGSEKISKYTEEDVGSIMYPHIQHYLSIARKSIDEINEEIQKAEKILKASPRAK